MSSAAPSMQALSAHFHSLQTTLPANGPGFSAIVLVHGVPVFELHHGLACMELDVPLSGKSRYYLGSESKQFTAACALDLVRKGALALDTDLRPQLPEIRQFDQAITLRQLLNHTSGIPDYLPCFDYQVHRHDSDYFDNTMILALIRKFDELDFEPGAQYDYSNSNYILLARLVEITSGQPLAAYARQLLFAPLGMASTGYDEDRHAIMRHRVRSYSADPARPDGWCQELGNANTIGDGGVYASSDDLVRWEAEWHRQYADPTSLVRSLLQETIDSAGVPHTYRFGLECLSHDDIDYVFHGGHLWGFHTLILRVPAAGVSVIQLSNHGELAADRVAILTALATDLGALRVA